MSKPDHFWLRHAAAALYGPFDDSTRVLREALKIAPRQWRRMLNGDTPIPDGVVLEIEGELHAAGERIDIALLAIVDFEPLQ